MDITEALKSCRVYAEKGYAIASQQYNAHHKALKLAETKIKQANQKQTGISRMAAEPITYQQMETIQQSREMDASLKRDLAAVYKRQKEFSLVVFGRTMAGKSTLMEILTHGDGKSIGKGGQRTTRDVRDYHWNGLKITDVPGIASFSGKKDDAIAMEAAKTADMILFLITDDAPQEDEAEKLADLRRLGKPVLGVVNVKQALNPARKALAIRMIKKKLDETERLDEICKQFRAFSKKWGQDWDEIPFVYTHLQAAFLADEKRENDPELFEASNFSAVENIILQKVLEDGSFLRLKTPIDIVTKPMQERLEQLLFEEGKLIHIALTYRNKWHNLVDWRNQYIEQAQKRFDRFQEQLHADIDSMILSFAENNYENKNAGEDWGRTFQNMKIDVRCRRFLENEQNICNSKRRELADELMTEISFNGDFSMDMGDISMEEITTYDGIAGVGAALAPFVLGGPLGWAIGIGAGLYSLFSDSKAEKIRKAQSELCKQLSEAMEPIEKKITDKVIEIMNEDVLRQGIDEFQQVLVDRDELFFELAGNLYEVASHLSRQLDEINNTIFSAACQYISDGKGKQPVLYPTARIPGMIFVGFGAENLSESYLRKIERLLDEKLDFHCAFDENERIDKVLEYSNELLGEDWKYNGYDYGKEEDYALRILMLPSGKSRKMFGNDTSYRIFEKITGYPLMS